MTLKTNRYPDSLIDEVRERLRLREKTAGAEHLTVEQVRRAASACILSLTLPPSARTRLLQATAERIVYYQHRNEQARHSHTRTTRRRLRRLGLKPHQLPSFVPDDS